MNSVCIGSIYRVTVLDSLSSADATCGSHLGSAICCIYIANFAEFHRGPCSSCCMGFCGKCHWHCVCVSTNTSTNLQSNSSWPSLQHAGYLQSLPNINTAEDQRICNDFPRAGAAGKGILSQGSPHSDEGSDSTNASSNVCDSAYNIYHPWRFSCGFIGSCGSDILDLRYDRV